MKMLLIPKNTVITFKIEEASKEIGKSLQIHEKDLVYKACSFTLYRL